MTPRIAVRLNAIGIYAICVVLLSAFYYQFDLGDLPCPLCLLQRVAFTALALGPVLTIRFGPRPFHYGVTIIAALAGAGIAMRQILLHIMPGNPGFGPPFMGLHFYTWSFLCFVAAIAACAVVLLFEEQFADDSTPPEIGLFEKGALWLILAITLVNAVSALLECGFAFCPGGPEGYELLQKI